MTNGSNVMIYMTLLYFKFYCTLVSIAKGKIAKSNKTLEPFDIPSEMISTDCV